MVRQLIASIKRERNFSVRSETVKSAVSIGPSALESIDKVSCFALSQDNPRAPKFNATAQAQVIRRAGRLQYLIYPEKKKPHQETSLEPSF